MRRRLLDETLRLTANTPPAVDATLTFEILVRHVRYMYVHPSQTDSIVTFCVVECPSAASSGVIW